MIVHLADELRMLSQSGTLGSPTTLPSLRFSKWPEIWLVISVPKELESTQFLQVRVVIFSRSLEQKAVADTRPSVIGHIYTKVYSSSNNGQFAR